MLAIDILLNQPLARVGAHIKVVTGDGDAGQSGSKIRDLHHVHVGGDVHTTVTDVYTNARLWFHSSVLSLDRELLRER
jgi:hypothetical protein